MALHAAGYEAVKGGGAHHYTIESLKFTAAPDPSLIDALQSFRAKRGGAVYEVVGIASPSEVDELRSLAMELRDKVLAWLREHHPKLV